MRLILADVHVLYSHRACYQGAQPYLPCACCRAPYVENRGAASATDACLAFVCAQLGYGLSTEYSKQPQASNQGKVDADRDKYAKFYVHQILSMGEEGIRDAYRRVSLV